MIPSTPAYTFSPVASASRRLLSYLRKCCHESNSWSSRGAPSFQMYFFPNEIRCDRIGFVIAATIARNPSRPTVDALAVPRQPAPMTRNRGLRRTAEQRRVRSEAVNFSASMCLASAMPSWVVGLNAYSKWRAAIFSNSSIITGTIRPTQILSALRGVVARSNGGRGW